MLLLAVSDVVWQAIIGGIVTVVGAYISYLATKMNAAIVSSTKATEAAATKADTAAVKADVAAVKAGDAATKIEKVAAVGVEKVEEVKQVLADTQAATVKKQEATDKKLDEIAKVGESTHTLVNSNMGVQLKLNMELSEWKAAQTKGTATEHEDRAAAEKARKLYDEHVVKQETVDKRAKE